MSETPTNIAIVHCHFETGGVTGVVQNHVECLRSGKERESIGKIVLLSGKRVSGIRKSTLAHADAIQIPELDYDAVGTDALREPSQSQNGDTQLNASSFERIKGFQRTQATHGSVAGQRLFELVDATLRSAGLKPEDSVIHWHNHSLGKNAAAPFAITHLANAGWRLLLQIHDFAEDQRPENVHHLIQQTGATRSSTLDAILYPTHPNIAYACLTKGDAEVLQARGIDASRVTTIPNSVRLPPGEMSDRETAMAKVAEVFSVDASSRWVLYPVRGIRRKNVGEFVLLCQLLPKGYVGALTLKPDTELESESYERWHTLAKTYVPDIIFDAAHDERITYADNLSACHCVLSTSVAEGFGMAFLEPWLASRKVVARNLPSVTSDFSAEGVHQPDLYDGVWIPGDADWIAKVDRQWKQAYGEAWALLPEPFRPQERLVKQTGGCVDAVDFARLLPSEQINTIRRIAEDAAFGEQVKKLNARLIESIVAEAPADLIESNRETIASRYRPDVQCSILTNAYQSLTSQQANQTSDSPDNLNPTTDARMIDLVASSHPFYPCRVEGHPVATLVSE
ncbi:glycosyltransferase family protein [Aporhodopirellula aestuarii]|uniref:Uncharacterized protein n=1 Tax=Aporhodopirellula aestuarii TaxID=2950107 RepID=A0ABT0U7R3_9BACT|nr:hypothetical protein [Aporhodopirellula aestuarii]MCM2372458.1 hypothetical protein [Aporhodopirellula aestuarii]